MVRSSFPGKPAKYFTRKKCSSSVNNLDVEGFTVAEELVKSLGVFDTLCNYSDEEPNLLGFSDADIKKAKRKACFKNLLKSINKSSTDKVRKTVKRKVELIEVKEEEDKICKSSVSPPPSSLTSQEEKTESLKHKEDVDSKECDSISTSTNALSGKFVLPHRSAHSSRVIKPNKRFFPNEQSSVVQKKSKNDSVASQSSDAVVNGETNLSPMKTKMDHETSLSPSSKVILRKPKLNLKSEPFPPFEGPFSTSSSSSLGAQDYKSHKRPSTKVVCGVCGTVRLYKNLQHARKFGIFSCELCRKFIVKILRCDREGSLSQYTCSTGNGTCQIRQSALEVNTFPVIKKLTSKSSATERCQACWLYVSLRSFRLPKDLMLRLNRYLPNSFAGKLDYLKHQASNGGEWSTGVEDIGSGSSALTCTTSQRYPRNKIFKLEANQRVEVKIFDNSRGPRIKHVCRSALQVLRQAPAIFPGEQIIKVTDEMSKDKKVKIEKILPLTKNDIKSDNSESMVEQVQEPSPTESPGEESDLSSGQPVARMLQDLGRCNNELLDWAEELGDGCQPRARVTIDYWQPYDPDEALLSGFPLLAPHPLAVHSVCFLCGSAGQHKLLHCLVCCEPYHTFCVPNLRFIKDLSPQIISKWICPKCTQCSICMDLGGTQQVCNKCHKSYHASCLSANPRFNATEATWTCPSCLCCKSCNGSTVDLFLGNLPLCKTCFKQRKKGNFCPLCQRCYDENDYSTKMMECGRCQCWVHADCEGISEEKYQVLSLLPSHIEFICRLCSSNNPPDWSLAVEDELKAGYLKVFKILTKNRAICSMIKSSPQKKPRCYCNIDLGQIRPLSAAVELSSENSIEITSNNPTEISSILSISSLYDDRNSGSILLTPKMTQDDEEDMKNVTPESVVEIHDEKNHKGEKIIKTTCPSMVLSTEEFNSSKFNIVSSVQDVKTISIGNESCEKSIAPQKCFCKVDPGPKSSLTLMSIKKKAALNEYTSVAEFHRDVNKVIDNLNVADLKRVYLKALKLAFPWFPLERVSKQIIEESPKKISFSSAIEAKHDNYPDKSKITSLTHASPCKPIYRTINDDKRMCVLCKNIGEGLISREERLLYCGNSEWVHANCALWSSEVFEEIDGSLQFVQSAMSRSRHIRCSVCSKKGASVGCCAKSCSLVFHFPCAIDSNCILLENKEVYCKNHKSLTESKELQKDFLLSRSIYVELDRRKKKDVPKDWAKLMIGALFIENFGEVLPEASDKAEFILPIDFSCSRLFWSTNEPLKLIKYYIKTKLIKPEAEYSPENDINYTIDHSLDFTPPPSPIEDLYNKNKIVDDKDVRSVLNQLIEAVCVKEEENNLVDQQASDLLPPEIKDALFEDLPHDLLADICMQDILPKMLNYDYFMSGEASNRTDRFDPHSNRNSPVEELEKCQTNDIFLKKSYDDTHKNKYSSYPRVDERKQVNLQCRLRSSVNISGLEKCSNSNVQDISVTSSKSSWKKGEIIQVDGQFDSSESDPEEGSDNESHLSIRSNYIDPRDKPVKCSRCHRTYRSNLGFTRHLPSCTTESSCSDSESSEDGKSRDGYPNQIIMQPSEICEEKEEREVEITYNCHIMNGTSEQTVAVEECTNTSTECIEVVQNSTNMEYSIGLVDGNYTVKQVHDCQLMQGFQPAQASTSSQTLVLQPIPEPVSYVSQYPTIQSAPSIQYVQESSPILTTGQFLPSYQIQPPITHQTVVQNVPTMLGTVVANHQPMILTNQSTISSYAAPQTALVIANQPVFVNMETVVSNTIMSSSQLISSSSVSGILETNSYSTTTQVYHSAKPPVEIPQSYVVVNGSPHVINNHTPCTAQVTQATGIIQPTNTTPWPTNYQVNYHESYKMDKNVPFPTLSKEIICEEKKHIYKPTINVQDPQIINPHGIRNKIISGHQKPPVNLVVRNNTRNESNNINQCRDTNQPCSSRINLPPLINKIKPNQIKKVDLPESSAVGKEKPQQAVAPVVVRNIPSYIQKKPLPNLVSNFYRNNRHNKQPPVLNKSEAIQTDINTHAIKEEPTISSESTDNVKNIVPSVPVEAVIPEKPVVTEHISQPENNKVLNGFKNALDAKKDEDVIKDATMKLHNKMKEIYVLPKFERKVSTKNELPPVDLPKKEPPVEKKDLPKLNPQVKLTSNTPNGSSNPKQENIGGPKISYEITSEDGFAYSTHNIIDAWSKVFNKVQEARASKGLQPLPQNPYFNENNALKGLMGLGSNSVKFILEQLPGASRCIKYNPSFHKRPMTIAEKLMASYRENRSGCARSEPLSRGPKSYDMFSWLASRHRRPPNLLSPTTEISNGNSRRGNLNLPMAMRFRYLKETSKISVGVFRSDIHGRGLFCLRNIDNGEMIIEYAGELIRSSLTDTRERYYTARGMGCYMFRIDDKYVVDATMKGNAARFINHSCEPNCYSRIVEILGKKHILIFALRRIKQGEELTYDYKFPLEEDKISCHCLSRKCRKYLN